MIFAVNIPFVIATLVLVSIAVPPRAPGTTHARVDWLGAVLTFFGLAGPVLALIRQPVVGWSSPQVWVPGTRRAGRCSACSSSTSGAPRRRCSRSACSSAATSRSGTSQTFTMYGGLSITFFLLVMFLQEVAGYSALDAGFALLPSTIVMFLLSKRMGRLADRYGPRLFMGLGPLTAAVGLALMTTLGAHVNYFTDLLPALLVFSLGLAATVAPLTAAVLSDADEGDAGIASGVNNAVARVAGLIAIAAIGAVISAQFKSTLDQHLAGIRLRRRRGPRWPRREGRRSPASIRRAPACRSPTPCSRRRSRRSTSGSGSRRRSSRSVALLGLVGIQNPRRAGALRGLRRRSDRRSAARRRARSGAGARLAPPAPRGADGARALSVPSSDRLAVFLTGVRSCAGAGSEASVRRQPWRADRPHPQRHQLDGGKGMRVERRAVLEHDQDRAVVDEPRDDPEQPAARR